MVMVDLLEVLKSNFFKSLILLNENLFYYLLILLTLFFFLISINFNLKNLLNLSEKFLVYFKKNKKIILIKVK